MYDDSCAYIWHHVDLLGVTLEDPRSQLAWLDSGELDLHIPMASTWTSIHDLDSKDFDGEIIGKGVSQALSVPSTLSKVTWTVVSASNFPGGAAEVGAAVLEERTWMAIISVF